MPAKKQLAKKQTPKKASAKNGFVYSKPFQRGEDTTSYRLVVEEVRQEGQVRRQAGPRRRPEGAHGPRARGDARRVVPPPAEAPAAGRGDPERPRGLAERPLHGDDAAAQRGGLGEVRAAVLPGHGHGDGRRAGRASRSGREPTTPRSSRRESGRPTPRRTSATRRRPRSRCTTRSTRATTCPRRSTSSRRRAWSTSCSSSRRAEARRTRAYLFQETKALLNPASLEAFLVEKMKSLGTAACPPYHIAFVVGGTSAEACLKTVKLASTGLLRLAPDDGRRSGRAFRDPELEKRLLERAQKLGFGAQFGGKYFAHDVRVIRLPRHGASCPVGHRRLVLGRPQRPREDRREGTLARGARAPPRGASPRPHRREGARRAS